MNKLTLKLPDLIDKKDIKEAYLFGSEAKGINGNDKDLALFIDQHHESFKKIGSEYNIKLVNIDYHIFPYNEFGKEIFYTMLQMKDNKYGTGKGIAIPIKLID